MNVSENPVFEDKLKRLKSLSQELGYRLTHQRLEILRELVAAKDHPSADLIYKRVKGRLPIISLDTVYRTLFTFEKIGLAMRVMVWKDQARFDGDLSPHHHFVCQRCGVIHDFMWPEFDELEMPDEEAMPGQVEQKNVVVRGVCRSCRDSAGSGLSQ